MKVRVRRLGKDEDPQEVVPAAIDFVSATVMAVSLEAKDLPPTTRAPGTPTRWCYPR